MQTAKTYGMSLHALAKDEKLENIILSELKSISRLFSEHPDYVKIIDSPKIEREEIISVLNDDFLGRVNRYTLNFLKLLSDKHMVHHLDKCVKEYERLYNIDNNIKSVRVTTAKAVSDETLSRLAYKLEKKLGGKIVIKHYIDESCIGGIIIEADGKRIDASIRTELDNIKQALSE